MGCSISSMLYLDTLGHWEDSEINMCEYNLISSDQRYSQNFMLIVSKN